MRFMWILCVCVWGSFGVGFPNPSVFRAAYVVTLILIVAELPSRKKG